MSVNHVGPSNILALDEASSSSEEDVNIPNGCHKRQSVTGSSSRLHKRNRKGVNDAIVDAMLEIAAASKLRATAMLKNNHQFSISHCIQVLDEMQGLDEHVYFFALDLFENPNARETFISLKNERRLTWLQGKFIGFNMDDYDLELDEMELVAAATGFYFSHMQKQPCHNLSSLGKSEVMYEILYSNSEQFYEMLRMDKQVFLKICDILRQKNLLRDTAGVKIEEQVAIFLNILGHNERNRVIQERFQHSGETISRHFNNALKAIKSLSREILMPPDSSTPPEILSDPRFYPYFKDCIGAMDAIYLPAHVPAKDQSRFRNRNGVVSQNVLAACTFDLKFIFIYPGWEGSATDSQVLRAVLNNANQNFPQIPEGKYYLVDGSYANMSGFISPFQGVRYHLWEFKGANQQPRSAQELFNHRHASLRKAIQLCSEILKARFPILKLAPQYAFRTQRDLVIAACVIHNLIRQEDPNDGLFRDYLRKDFEPLLEVDDQMVETPVPSVMQDHPAFVLRDSIAAELWSNFMNEWDSW